MERKNAWTTYTEEQTEQLERIITDYKLCLSMGKTERECVKVTLDLAAEAGYRNLKEVIEAGEALKAGDKVYVNHMGKAVALFNIGSDPLEKGMNILGAHLDSPRIDVKMNPLYEADGMALLDTHYYGGIKKYQWVTIPLAIHGVVCKKDGSVQNICIGEKEDDPVFVISDILPHLGRFQGEKKAGTVIEGENLDVVFASKPAKAEDEKDEKEAIKANVLKILEETYGINEEDFLSAELEVIPAGKARDLGIDRSMILGYGHDDRSCAFPSLFAMLDVETVERTACTILVDKEEIGSVGATGMHSKFFENAVAEILALLGETSDLKVRRTLQNSTMISSDVSAAVDPMFPECFEKKNCSFLGRGIVLNKFTGARGKSGASDCSPEFLARLRKVFDDNGVNFQYGELGKVDVGGGGTIAYIMANYGMEVIDAGVPVLAMHAPWETVSKADVYEAYRAYKAFIEDMR